MVCCPSPRSNSVLFPNVVYEDQVSHVLFYFIKVHLLQISLFTVIASYTIISGWKENSIEYVLFGVLPLHFFFFCSIFFHLYKYENVSFCYWFLVFFLISVIDFYLLYHREPSCYSINDPGCLTLHCSIGGNDPRP